MTNRSTNLSSKDSHSLAESRLNQQIRSKSTNEGCPVIDESGTVCGERDSLSIFQEFRKIYEDCLKKLEGSSDGSILLRKLAPFRKIIDDLWEQNTMLVEAVEELEQEANCQVTNLQNKLDKSCQKIFEYRRDIKSLIEIIQRYKEEGEFDSSGILFEGDKKRREALEQSNKVSFCDTEDCILSNCDADSDTTQDCCCDECMNGVVSCSKEDYLEFNDCLNSKVSSGHIFSSVNCPNKNKSGSEDTYAKRSISQCRLKNIYKTNESKECFCEESANEDTLKLISVNFTLPKQTQKNTKCCDCSGMQDVKNPNLNS